MKRLTCEMCGGIDLIKQDGLFVCQHCGMQYSAEDAKKMMIDGTVDVQGTVKVDNSAFVEKYLSNARRAKQKEDWAETEKYYNMVEQNDPTNIEAIFYSSFAKVKSALVEADTKDKRQSIFNPLANSVSVIDDNYDNTSEKHHKLLVEILEDIIGLKSGTIVPTTHLQDYVTKNGCVIVDRSQVVENDSLDVTYNMVNKVIETYIDSLANITKNSASPVNHLLKAVALMGLEKYKESLNEVVAAAKYPITEGDKEDIERLVEMVVYPLRKTLLINAAEVVNYEAIKYLVEAGSNVNFQENENKTALWHLARTSFGDESKQIAARKGVKILLDAGADANVTANLAGGGFACCYV